MNQTKIEYCDYTWNPITGCRGGCPYCYARAMFHRFKKSFEPAFHPERLQEVYDLKKPSLIFAGSVTDFWGRGVKAGWRQKVFNAMADNPQHTFLVLTKCPDRIRLKGKIPNNVWMGVSITRESELKRARDLVQRTGFLINWNHRFISFEPLLEDIGFINISLLTEFHWAIIGAMTGPNKNNCRPRKQWIDNIVSQFRGQGIPVFIKNNASYKPKLQEYPYELEKYKS